MDSRITHLLEQGSKLFTDRQALESLWQEFALNFYVERAGFTGEITMGGDFASHLTTSYPLLARRDLGNSFSSMLRPKQKEWFEITIQDNGKPGHDGKTWLEEMRKRMRRAMYETRSQFVRATREGDHDFAAFGQCVLSVELNRFFDGLLFRCWHLRDCVWTENIMGQVDVLHRKWKPQAYELKQLFRGNVSKRVAEKCNKEPFSTVECRHVVMPTEIYANMPGGAQILITPYVSIYFEVDTGHILEEKGVFSHPYVVPRWQTVSGSQYAHSPATVAALPDARLLQSISLTLLEAGEKAVSAPMIATQEAVRSDVQLYAGGITWVDSEYDERLGAALRPISQDKSGLPFGLDMQQDIREMVSEAFYLNKLNMPPSGGDMTAYEVGQRVQEFIRQALPLFEPMEMDYNGQMCERIFDVMQRGGFFGNVNEMPDSLSGKDFEFRFESPLHDAVEAQKGQKLLETKALLTEAAAIDQSSVHLLDVRVALRDALDGIKTPERWLRADEEVNSMIETEKQQQQAQVMMEQMQQGGQAAEQMGKGVQAMQQMGV